MSVSIDFLAGENVMRVRSEYSPSSDIAGASSLAFVSGADWSAIFDNTDRNDEVCFVRGCKVKGTLVISYTRSSLYFKSETSSSSDATATVGGSAQSLWPPLLYGKPINVSK